MSETTPQRPARRTRTPKQDPVLVAAVDLARDAVLAPGTNESSVGEHLGVTVHEDRLLTHLFDCRLAAYPGWTWYATVARAPRSKHVTVCETGLVAGPDSLLAPEWVPWEERLQALHDQDEHACPEAGEGHPTGEGDPRGEASDATPSKRPERESHEGSEAREHPGSGESVEDHGRTCTQDESVHGDAHPADLRVAQTGASEGSSAPEQEPAQADNAEDGATS